MIFETGEPCISLPVKKNAQDTGQVKDYKGDSN